MTLFEEKLDLVKGIAVNEWSVRHCGIEHILLASIAELFERDCGVAISFLVFTITAVPFIPKDISNFGGTPG